MKPKGQSVIFANNDVIYIWWRVPRKIKNCLGFSLHRVVKGKEESKGLYATVGFGVDSDERKSPQTTDEWPIQSFNWKDLYAPHDVEIQYRIYPMVGSWDNLNRDAANVIITSSVRRTKEYGDMQVIFNRGILSTQAFAKTGIPGKSVTQAEARKFITDPTNEWRKRLGGEMLKTVNEFFNLAKSDGGSYYAALYELTDVQLIEELTRNKNTEIILGNANSSKSITVDGKSKTLVVDDGTNKLTRAKLHKIKTIKVYDRMLGSHIAHNKFVIYVDKKGIPVSVLTGSTNWTATGLCGQTNNMVVINSEKIAGQYKCYWDQMKLEQNAEKKQGKPFRAWCADNRFSTRVNGNKTDVTLWFSPNTVQSSKTNTSPTPVDMLEVFSLIEKAKESVLYLVFNPGSPSIIEKIQEVAKKRGKNNPLFVRGAVSDAKIAKNVTTNIVSSDILKRPDTYYFDRVTGVAAIPGPFSYFEGELLKLGFSTIHDKLLVIDPFDKDCVVILGSHNLGYAASYKNDENMVIIQKDRPIAKAYAAHVLDVVNHFKWRYKLQAKIIGAKAKTIKEKQAILHQEWNDLSEADTWMDYYFNSKGFIERDKFIF